MKIGIGRPVYEKMKEAAQASTPLEACGLLAGRGGHVTEFYQLANADGSAEHFSMDPAEQFAAIKDIRRKGLELLAIWHSHPSTPPRMSDEDLRLAHTPGVAYVIVSLVTPGKSVSGFEVIDGAPQEIVIVIADG